nr:tRNA (cytidine(34)-2'-O)-methyltransferase [Aestuariispira insulae]
MRLALYQPEIPQNAGTLLRFAACMGLGVDVIEPCGFVWSEQKMRRAGMDYLDAVEIRRHRSWDFFRQSLEDEGRRLALLTTKGAQAYTDYSFAEQDTLMVGRESAGVPEEVHAAAHARLLIPMAPEMRSINVAVSAAMVLGEALRQTGGFPQS